MADGKQFAIKGKVYKAKISYSKGFSVQTEGLNSLSHWMVKEFFDKYFKRIPKTLKELLER